MDLRVKCKCGKLLQIPEALAGKKVSCPGCKKLYRIPAEKFGLVAAAGPTAARPAAAAGAPARPAAATEIDALISSPSEIDISPSQLDLLGDLGASSSDLVSHAPAQPAALKECPNCRKVMVESSVLCTACGFNTATGKVTKSKALKQAAPGRRADSRPGGGTIAKILLLLILVGGVALVGWYFLFRS